MSSANTTKTSLITKKRALLSVLIIAAFLIPLSVRFHSSLASAFTLASTHQPEKYSELYFNKPASLPKYAKTGSTQEISFGIVNHEAESVSYVYQVTISIGNQPRELLSGNIKLNQGQAATLPVHFSISSPNTAAIITVTLPNQAEQIVFRSHS